MTEIIPQKELKKGLQPVLIAGVKLTAVQWHM